MCNPSSDFRACGGYVLNRTNGCRLEAQAQRAQFMRPAHVPAVKSRGDKRKAAALLGQRAAAQRSSFGLGA